jgi:outer membrane protein, heavy metal efflux system
MTKGTWLIAASIGIALATGGCVAPAQRAAFGELDRVEIQAGYRSAERELPELGVEASVEDYLLYAALNNPGLEAAFNRWKAALERVPQVTALPDPRFTYRYFIEQVETRVGPQRHGVGISQRFPWFGKLEQRGGAAMEQAHAMRQRYEAAKLALFSRVRNAYAETFYLTRSIAVVRENLDLAKNLEGVVRERYRTGHATNADLIRAQVELGRVEDRLRTVTDLQGPIAARLNAALGRPAAAALPRPTALPAAVFTASDDEVIAWLREASPELRAMRHDIARHEHAVALARKEYYPDITLGLDYIDTGSARMPGVPDSSKDPVIATVSINVPLWLAKYRAGERESEANLRAATLARADRENTLEAEAKMVLYQFRDAERKIDLYRDTLLPKARQALRAAMTAFEGGKASFTDLVDAERVWLEFHLMHERARADREQRLADIERLTGKQFPRREREENER